MVELSNFEKAGYKISRKRKGRGPGSGNGKTSCRGHKGAKARSGYKIRKTANSSQVPLYRKIPKRGNGSSRVQAKYKVLTLYKIFEMFDTDQVVEYKTVKEKGYFTKNETKPLKVIGTFKSDKKLSLRVGMITDGARKCVEEAGGSIEILK